MKKKAKPVRPMKLPSLGEAFAVNLRRYRERMELSQSALAARAGYTSGHVSMLERGTRLPTLEAVEHLAAALNVTDPRKMFAVKG